MQQQSAKTVPAASSRHDRCSSSNGEPTHGRGRSDPIPEELVVLRRCWRNNCSFDRYSRHWRIQLRPHQAWKQIESFQQTALLFSHFWEEHLHCTSVLFQHLMVSLLRQATLMAALTASSLVYLAAQIVDRPCTTDRQFLRCNNS